jgi:1-deoxy-D-xylulose-5-phosphate reductoisomerase
MKKVLILGSTGSIGTQALEVIAGSPELEVTGLAAAASFQLLAEQALTFGVKDIAIVDEKAGIHLADALPGINLYTGSASMVDLIDTVDCDLVLNAIVGAAGLDATIASIERGIDLALANKESLVVGGSLVMRLAQASGTAILPVDSEHSAIFQCLEGSGQSQVEHIFLTASGGPFLGKPREALAAVSREQALKHPRWEMGSKISIDSATLMNKGLEIIEAHHLFDTDYEDIEVLIHPQSIVHSLVRYPDGSVLAQLGLPSMKLPIAYALNYPRRRPVDMPRLDLAEVGELTFMKPDTNAFPCLRLAREAGERGEGAPIVLNAANEIAVAAFLAGSIGFLGIPDTVERTMEHMGPLLDEPVESLDQIYEIDSRARLKAKELVS